MVRIIITAVQTTPKLAQCSRGSFFGAVMRSCELALEPNTPLGQAYLIPRWNSTKKCLECNFQIGYQGILELAYRSKTVEYRRITAEIVYEGDTFDYEYGIDAHLTHKPKGKSEKPLYAYALYELKNGGRDFKVWPWEKIMKHAERFSESFDKSFSPWKSNQESKEAMAKKTVLVNLLKYAPKSAKIASAVGSDERTLNMRRIEDGSHSFISVNADDFLIEPEDPEANPDMANAEKADPVSDTVSAEKNAAQQPAPEQSRTADTGNGQPKPVGTPQREFNRNTRDERAPEQKGGGDMFFEDEEAALQEMYEQRAPGTSGPDFG
jgi:recombination protein RecT